MLLVVGCLIANSVVKKHGYRNLWHFVTNAGENYMKASSDYEILQVKIKKEDFQKLKKLRQKAIDRGVQVNESNGFVKAELIHNGKKIKAKIRLKGHMTDHLGEKKWSFRIHTKKGNAFMGMKMFSLQSPGTRNYIYEWIYHEMMRKEGIIALKYDFIKLKVNKEDWGIYALEENFGQQLIQRNHRAKGPIIRFDPELYWISRINELDKIQIKEEYATMQSAFIDVYDDKTIFGDSTLIERYAQAVRMMESFRQGNLSTSQVFDVKKLASFHAIIDLVGGHHSIDWSDIKYYYNPETNLLEPVAYESFSVNPTYSLTGSSKFSADRSEYITNWHEALFSDPEFFREYIKQVNKLISKKWLDGFFKGIKKEMDHKLAILYNEFYTKEFNLDQYYKNQENIKHILASPSGMICYYQKHENDTLYLKIGGIDALPYEIVSVTIDSTKFKLKSPKCVNSKMPNSYVNYSLFAFPLDKNAKISISPRSKIKLTARVLGHRKMIEQNVQMLCPPDERPKLYPASDLSKLNFISINNLSRTIVFKSGDIVLNELLVIPSGYTVHINEGTTIRFNSNSGIISYSPLEVKGSEDFPVTFTCSDSVSGYIAVLNANQKASSFEGVQFLQGGKQPDKDLACAVRVYNSTVSFKKCIFADQSFDGLRISNSKAILNFCQFGRVKKTAIECHYADVEIKNSKVANSGGGIRSIGSKTVVSVMKFHSIKKTGIEVAENSYFQGNNIEVNKCKTGIASIDCSDLRINSLNLSNNQIALNAGQKGEVFGPSKISIGKLTQKNNKLLKKVEYKSTINILE